MGHEEVISNFEFRNYQSAIHNDLTSDLRLLCILMTSAYCLLHSMCPLLAEITVSPFLPVPASSCGA